MRSKVLSWILTAAMALSLFLALPNMVVAVDSNPYATIVSISGNEAVGSTLTGTYTYNSGSGSPESGTTFRWLKSGDPVELYTNYVYTADGASGPSEDTVFTLDEITYLTGIKNYHSGDYNEPGMISLRDENGIVYGPWQAKRAESYTTFYWLVTPKIVLPAGTYTVVDSNPSTWTYNDLSEGQGHTWVYGSGFSEIAGETEASYTVDIGDYLNVLCFEVTVRDNTGTAGTPVRSYSDPVIAYWSDLLTQTDQYPFAGGNGTKEDPYLIATPLQLAQLAYNTANEIDYFDKHFKQIADIDIGALQWNPIGASATQEFRGHFDGNNKVIRNMTIGTSSVPSDLEEIGLFGYVANATIQNVNIENASIFSSLPDYYGEIGVLAGEVNSSLIHHCTTSGTMNVHSYSGSYVGGLIGKIDYYTEGVVACSSSVNITVSSGSSGDIGGLIGEAYGPVIGCRASGSVSGYGYLGGLVGNSTDIIIDCYATGTITGSYMAGGLVGYHDGTILNSYAIGAVTGHEYAGGLVGFNNYYSHIKNSFATGAVSAGYTGGSAGGLIGSNCGEVLNSYAAGQVTYGQGLLDYLYGGGYLPAAIAEDCYWNSSLNATGGAGIGKTAEQMQAVDFVNLLNDEQASGRDGTYRSWKIISSVNNNIPVLDGVGIGMSDSPPVVSSAMGVHNLAAEAEISFVSSALGQYYYKIVPAGSEVPDFDTTGSGILCYSGINEYTLPVSTGAWDIYIVVKDTADALSEPVKIAIAEEPALFAGGIGTESDPYQITSAYHLNNVRYYLGGHFILLEDIDLDPDLIGDAFWYDSNMGWNPIGAGDSFEAPFTGRFDGNGKKVSNMKITYADPTGYRSGCIGLFGYVNETAVIRDLGIVAFEISSTCSSGSAGGLAGALYGTVDHCFATGSISVGAISAGGLVGGNYTGTITNSWADADIESAGWSYVGGLTGFNNGYIRNCAATGNVQAGISPRAGGLTGNNYAYFNEADIQNCYAAGNVSGSGWGYVGPFYGENYENYPGMAFEDCYWNEDALINAAENGGASPTVHGSTDKCLAVDSDYMKTQAFVDTLNAGLPDSAGYYQWEIRQDVNSGYPILKDELPQDLIPPNVSNGIITASGITKNSAVLSWNAANDNSTASDALLYKLYRSGSDNISSVSNIEANGTPVTNFDSIGTYTVTGLSPATTYYFNIIVKDRAGNKAEYQTVSVTTLPEGGSGSSYIPNTYSITATANAGGTITPGNSMITEYSSITFTIKPDKNYIIQDVMVDGKSVGAVNTYTFSSVTANHRIEAKFEHECQSKSFNDVDTSLWYHEGIDFVLSNGLFNGTSETTFEPNADMTRAMLVTVLWRLDKEPDSTEANLFIDVADGTWYTEAVKWAVTNHIVEGYNTDLFGPDNPITREQIAAILYRYASYKGYDVTLSNSMTIFTDTGDISAWAMTAMKWAVAEGLVTGVSKTRLDPAGNASRAQVAVILMRFVENVVN